MIITSIAPNPEEESDFPLAEIDTASMNSLVRQGKITNFNLIRCKGPNLITSFLIFLSVAFYYPIPTAIHSYPAFFPQPINYKHWRAPISHQASL